MKNILLSFILSITLFSCNTDDNEIQTEDHSSFLEKTTPQFSAYLDDDLLNWKFGADLYQVNLGYFYPNGDSTDPNRYLRFTLNQENGSNQFVIYTPIYDTSSDVEFNDVFGLGLKKLGNSDEDFFISLTKNNITYAICNSELNFQIEILKAEESIENNSTQKVLKVWIKIENMRLNDCDPNYNKNLNKGLILAKFYGHRFD